LPEQCFIGELQRLRPNLAQLGITRMALFGSRAREDNRPDSDIDLIVDVRPGRKFSLLDLVGVAHVVEDNIGLPANVFMRRSLAPDFLRHARRDEVVIFDDQ
jgi:predicted nucleotidyltransferase